MWNDSTDYRPETEQAQFESMTNGLDRETLTALRDGLEAGNPAALEYFGLETDYTPEPEPQESYAPDQFESLTGGLDKETLAALRDGLEAGDPVALDYFGLDSTGEDDGQQQPVKKLTRSIEY